MAKELDFCDNCTRKEYCQVYDLDNTLFVWCENCADEEALLVD